MITLRDINFRYPSGKFRLGIDQLDVPVAARVAFIGPSGSGKSTLLNLIAGILLPETGTVSVDGYAINTRGDKDRRDFRIANIGFVFQDFGLIDYLNILDNILHAYRITSTLKIDDDVRQKAKWFAQKMGIGNKLERHPMDLSQGERQRVAICRALLPEPKLILADEATGNLDPANKDMILNLLFRMTADHGTTLLAVTHDHELLHYFDRVIDFREFLSGGRDEK